VLKALTSSNKAIGASVHYRSDGRLTAIATLNAAAKPGEYYGVLIVETTSEFNPQIRIPVFATIESP
jgi:hypothetical protein